MGSKIESLQKLINLGVNTPNFEILTTGEEVMEFIKRGEKTRRLDAFSIRTDNKKGQALYKKWGLPFFPNKPWGEIVDILNKELLPLIDEKIDIIVAEGINPKDSLISGRYLRNPKEGDILDYIRGPSTGRDVDRGSPESWIPTSSYKKELPLHIQGQFMRVSNYARNSFPRAFKTSFVIEFSVYPYPIGRLKDKLIFWEVIKISF